MDQANVTSPIGWLARLVLGDYARYLIYEFDSGASGHVEISHDVTCRRIHGEEELASADPELGALAGYLGEEAFGYVALVDDRPVAACFFWTGDRYRRRNFWPLASGEAKLVEVRTAEAFRGRGVGASLIGYASADMLGNRGFKRLYARIWHSNRPSIRAFQNAGWRRIALVTEVRLLRVLPRLRFVRRRRQR